MINRRRTLVILAVMLLLITNATTYVVARRGIGPGLNIGDPRFEKFLNVLQLVENRFVDKVDEQKIIEGATAGLVKATGDPYSSYLDPREWRELMIRASGNYAGIGVHIVAKDRYISVIAPIKGTPAEKAGFKPGDMILKVDGQDIVDMTSDKVAELIRGTEGTKVKLTVVRQGSAVPFEVEVTRAKIDVPAADWKMLETGVGYIQLREFNSQATKQTQQAIQELKAKGAKAFVLDLRSNPGGLVDEAVGVSDLFIGKGPVVHVVDRSGKKETLSAKGQPLGLPLVVLIDGGSASASEIVAGAIQDTGVGTLVGTKSFGKGSVQHLMTLQDGSGLKLTTQKYYTPSGRSIHGVGIEPDVKVTLEGQSMLEPLVSKRTWKKGDVSLDVMGIQQRLKLLGYAPEIEGAFGSATEGAVKRLQAAQGIPQSGVVDARTLEALNQAVTAKQSSMDVQLDKAVETLKQKIK